MTSNATRQPPGRSNPRAGRKPSPQRLPAVPDVLPNRIEFAEVQRWIARFGALTTDQLAALIAWRPPSAISPHDQFRMLDFVERHRQKHNAADQGETKPPTMSATLDVTVRHTKIQALRPTDRRLFRLTPGAMDAPVLDGRPGWRRVVDTIHRLQSESGYHGWAEEGDLKRAAFAGYSSRKTFLQKLRPIIRAGLLVEGRIAPKGGYVTVVQLPRKTLKALTEDYAARGLAPPVHTRTKMSTLDHHLMTVQAALWVLFSPSLLDGAAEVLGFESDEMMRQRQRTGSKTTEGDTYGAIPDGRLGVGIESRTLWVDLEVLTRGYKDDQIVARLRGLPPNTTLYVVDCERTLERCHQLIRNHGIPGAFMLRLIDELFG
jgi:hypothetical protein